jgi:hypothetical protein
MKQLLCALYLLITVTSAFSQKIKYAGMQQFSLSVGDYYSRPGFNLLNGIRYTDRYFVGIGAMVEFIKHNFFWTTPNAIYRPIPIYLDGRYYVGKKGIFLCRE